jgi:uncharacterized protein
VVTGASSGIGRAFAEQLARRGDRVLAVARRADRLAELVESARPGPGEIVAVVADLGTAEGMATTLRAIDALPEGLSLLVNNAGFGESGPCLGIPVQRDLECIAVNIAALVELTRRVLPPMVERRRGGVINVASTIGFQPVPYFATYAATKAFVLHYTEAIATELRGTGVHVTAVCPGPVTTEFESISGNAKFQHSVPNLAPDRVAAEALAAHERGRIVHVVGWLNRLMVTFNGMMPRWMVRSMMARFARPGDGPPAQLIEPKGGRT